MLPVLQAEDQLDRIDAVAAGHGRMRRDDLQGYLHRLRRQADAVTPARPATRKDLASIGIPIIEEE